MAQEKSWVWRLVVADVLPGDREAVSAVVHQRAQPIRGGNGRRVDPQKCVVGGTPDDFFAPVSEEIGGQSRRGFSTVIGRSAFCCQQPDERGGRGIPLGDPVAIENFAKWIRVPPHGKVR